MPGSVVIYKYHGASKVADLSRIQGYDIVFTTYATLTADFVNISNVLQRVNWFRLVLDEGKLD
jgi:SNF2 family DNA or RNA helicase